MTSRSGRPRISAPVAGRDVADADAEPGVGRRLAVRHLLDDRQHLVDRDREAEADRAVAAASSAVRIEELMPTTLPARSTSGPPLLPGLIAASVWIAGYVVALPCPSEPTLTGRLSALTMPLVTVDSRPNGEPIATTASPTLRSPDEPIVAGVRPETPSAWITAVSVSGSVPRTCLGRGAVVERDAERAAVGGDLDHVVVGEDLAVRGEDDAGAGARALRAGDVDLHDRRQHLRRRPPRRCRRGGSAVRPRCSPSWRSCPGRRRRAVVAVQRVVRRGAADAGATADHQGRGQDAGRERGRPGRAPGAGERRGGPSAPVRLAVGVRRGRRDGMVWVSVTRPMVLECRL